MLDELLAKFNSNKKTIFFIVDIAIAFIYLFIMAYSFSRPLRDIVSFLTGNSIIVITIYFLVFHVLYFIVSLPLKYFRDLTYIKTNNFIDWIKIVFKKEISVFFALFFVIQVIYFFLETDVLWWWLPVAFLCIVFRFAMELAPKYLSHLFFKSTALDPSEFKLRLIELVGRANIKINDVFSIAYAQSEAVIFSGRLMLSDKIMDYAPEEIEVIVARETAMHYYGHIKFRLIIEALIMLLSFFIVNIAFKPIAAYFGFEFIFDIETLPVLLGLFFVSFLLMSFIQNYFFRLMDKQADIYALKMAGSPDAFISLLFRKQQEAEKQTIDFFINQILTGRISDVKRIVLAQDYAQEMSLKNRGV